MFIDKEGLTRNIYTDSNFCARSVYSNIKAQHSLLQQNVVYILLGKNTTMQYVNVKPISVTEKYGGRGSYRAFIFSYN